jgi:ribosomal 50S subunit-recycling heat shock protein
MHMFSHVDTLFDISITVNTCLEVAGGCLSRGVPSLVRLDKFMKVSRLSKRRSEAHEALEHGRITKDGKALKPGYQVKPGDVLDIHYATRFVTVLVRDVPLRVTPSVKPADLYEVVSTRRDDPADWA